MPIRINEERGVRYLQFSPHWIQGAMRLSRPWALELDYTREMMMALLLRNKRGWPGSVLQIGLGAASITKFLHRYLPKTKLDVVEIDPEVVLNAWQFFEMPQESDRLRIEIADGYKHVVMTRKRFDLILANSLFHHIDTANTERILAHLATLLSDDGYVHVFDLVLPPRPSIARFLARADRGDYPRPLEEWREIFTRALEPVVVEPYPLGVAGIALWSMIYFKGRARR